MAERDRRGRRHEQRVAIGRRARDLAAPMFMLPPAMFSTTVGLPHLRPSWSAMSRARMSVVDPGADGTTIFTVCEG